MLVKSSVHVKKMLYPHEWHGKNTYPSIYRSEASPYNRNNMYPVQTQGKMDTPYIRNRHTPYKRKEIPPYNRKRKYGPWIMPTKQKSSIYKLKHRQACYVHKARTWDNRGLKKQYKGK